MIYTHNIMSGCMVFYTHDEKYMKMYKNRRRELHRQNHVCMNFKNIIHFLKNYMRIITLKFKPATETCTKS
jgi:hypothetical protein